MNFASYEVDHPTEYAGRPRRYALSPKDQPLVSSPHPTIKTLYDVLLYGVRTYEATRPLFGFRQTLRIVEESKEVSKTVAGVTKTETKTWKFPELSPYSWVTYMQVYESVNQIGSGLVKLGLKPKEKLTIFHSTSKEWMTVAQACYSQNFTITTAYDNLGVDALTYSLNECEVSILFTQSDLLSVVKQVGDKVPTLKHVIYSGTATNETLKEVQAACPNLEFHSLIQVQELGRLNPAAPNPPSPEDLCCIMYTSGSTGNPKGVMLSHSNMVGAVGGAYTVLKEHLTDGGSYLAYLPLAHVLEFIVQNLCVFSGIQVGYGTPRTLTDASVRNCKGDLGELKPLFMVGVPAVWETIRKGIVAKLDNASSSEKYVFNKAYQLKKRLHKMNANHGFVDRTVFKKIQEATGGNLKLALSGGAPMAPETQEFLTMVLCHIIQGYGMTETCGAIAVQSPNMRGVYGVCGGPFPHAEIKLVKTTNYNPNPTDGSNPQGEVWIRGTNVMQGYYKQPELTAEVLTEDGWLKTGDVGEWKPDGNLIIIDRVKNLVKLSHGEYVAIEKLESQYKTSRYVANMVVYADPLQSYIIAIVVANEVEVGKLAKTLGVDASDLNNPKILEAMVKDFAVCARVANFKGAEILKAIYVTNEEWTTDNGLLTAAQKLNRKPIMQKYATEVDKLYGKN
ncbi:long-chain fatty acid-CoA ligase [Globomyces sp. JEL0801]|nr:long-chain fatty acid-CoA ligase [Globomyces sp. JEL0801]